MYITLSQRYDNLAYVTLTFKMLFLSLFLKNVVLCNLFLKEKANYNLNNKIAFKTLYEFPIFNQKIYIKKSVTLTLKVFVG